MRTALISLGVVVVFGALQCGNKYRSIRSDLSAQRLEAHEEWTNLGEALDRRARLISDLASNKSLGESATVAAREVSAARHAMAKARAPYEKLAANHRLSAELTRLMLDVNRNPRMQSDAALGQWKEELANCENQVAVERSRYNKLLEKYNARIQQFPDSLVASVAGFRRNDAYFKTDEAEFEGAKK